MTPFSVTLRRAGRRVLRHVPESVAQPLRNLAKATILRGSEPPDVAATDNLAYNKALWDWYSDRWADPAFRREALADEGRPGEDPDALRTLGEEWGRLEDVKTAIDDWILPEVRPGSVVGEIGSGGGRVSKLVAPHAGEFHAFDISAKLLLRVKAELEHLGHGHFHLLEEAALPPDLDDSFDFIYSFDAFVHIDLHVQWQYFQAIRRALKPGGRAMLHTANLTTDAGWNRFSGQKQFRVEWFYFMTPEAVRTLANRAGLRIVREQSGGTGNFYYERDYFILLEKA